MHISGLTGSQVWLSSSRSLTNIGSGALAATSILRTTLAVSANVDLRPSAGTLGQLSVGVQTGAAATAAITISIYDGTNATNVAATGAGASLSTGFTMTNTSAVGLFIHNNDAANTGFYTVAAYVFTI